jgi:hypothetical protein
LNLGAERWTGLKVAAIAGSGQTGGSKDGLMVAQKDTPVRSKSSIAHGRGEILGHRQTVISGHVPVKILDPAASQVERDSPWQRLGF